MNQVIRHTTITARSIRARFREKSQIASAAIDQETINSAVSEFKQLPLFKLPHYKPELFVESWINKIGIPPIELASYLSRKLEGLSAEVSLDHDSTTGNFTIGIFAVEQDSGCDIHDPFAPYMKAVASYNIGNKTIILEDSRNNTGIKGLGKAMSIMRMELGHALGCTDVTLSSTQIGNTIWPLAFNTRNASEKFLGNVTTRLENLRGDISPQLYEQIKAAIEQEDLYFIASLTQPALTNMKNPDYARLIESSEKGLANLTLAKILLYDSMIDCFEGYADLTNPSDLNRLYKVFGQKINTEHPIKPDVLFRGVEPA